MLRKGRCPISACANRVTTLVVEDDHDNREILVKLLRHTGLLVDSASTLAEALRKLAASPTVVLLDMNLPDGTGADVLTKIRSDGLPITVGVITGSGELEARQSLAALAPDAIFIKPVIATNLCEWVKSILARGGAGAAVEPIIVLPAL